MPLILPSTLRLHRWLGLSLGLWFALAGISGSVLVFWHELEDAAWPESAVATAGEGSPVRLEAVIAAAQARHPKAVAERLLLPEAPGAPMRVRLWVPASRTEAPYRIFVHVDPRDAAVLGERAWGGAWIHVLYGLHSGLLLGEVAQTAVGLAGLAFAGLLLLGLVQWLRPFGWPWRRGEAVVASRQRAAGPSRRGAAEPSWQGTAEPPWQGAAGASGRGAAEPSWQSAAGASGRSAAGASGRGAAGASWRGAAEPSWQGAAGTSRQGAAGRPGRGSAGPKRGLRRLRHWHRVAGGLALLPLLVMGLTGAGLSFPDPLRGLLGPLVPTEAKPVQRAGLGRLDLAGAVAAAEAALPGWRVAWLELEPEDAPVALTLRPADRRRLAGAGQAWVALDDGEVLEAAPGNAVETVRAWVMALHNGTVLGLAHRLFIVALGLAPAVLAATGWLAWRRRRRNLRAAAAG